MLWSREHERVNGVIDNYNQVSNQKSTFSFDACQRNFRVQVGDEDHLYHLVYDDVTDQVEYKSNVFDMSSFKSCPKFPVFVFINLLFRQWATLPNKKVEIIGWVGDEEECRSAAAEQGQKMPPQPQRPSAHSLSNTSAERNSADKVALVTNFYSVIFSYLLFLFGYRAG